MERLSVSSVHKERKLGAHQCVPHHNLYLHHGKHPQAPGLEDLARSVCSQQSQRHTLPFHELLLAPLPVGSLIDHIATCEYWTEK